MCIKSEVEEILFLNLQQMTIVMRPSCWHKKFGPNGLSAPAQGLCFNFYSSITADFNISSDPSRHDWKIVDWDVKPQHKQTYPQHSGPMASRFILVLSETPK